MFSFRKKDKSKDETKDKKKERKDSKKESKKLSRDYFLNKDVSISGSQGNGHSEDRYVKHPPPVAPKPRQTSSMSITLKNGNKEPLPEPRGILKQHFGSSKVVSAAQKYETTAAANNSFDDSLAWNTIMNEQYTGYGASTDRKKRESIHNITMNIAPPPTPPPSSPSEKVYSVNLTLPTLSPPKPARVRDIVLTRQPRGDFGFNLRRAVIGQGKQIVFAEPGSLGSRSGLMPGDRLLEVNGVNVEDSTREEIVHIIKQSDNKLHIRVQVIPEASELSQKSPMDVQMDVRGGISTRSGDMRYRVTKTDQELESEKAIFSQGIEKLWLIHKGGFSACQLLDNQAGTPEGRCKVVVEQSGDVLEVNEEDVEKCNPSQFNKIGDLSLLVYLNECSILHTLRQRYGSSLIHTFSGPALVVFNPLQSVNIYSEKVVQMFKGCKEEDMPPHIYATAQKAYRNMLTSSRDQSLVFMGCSGSGKTSCLRHSLIFYALAYGGKHSGSLEGKLAAAATLLEAFGNCRTVINTNASRFTQLVSVDFDPAGYVASVFLQALMVEKSRLIRRPEGEPTFHIFYYLLSGAGTQLRNDLFLNQMGTANLFMTPLQRPEEKKKAAEEWLKVEESFGILAILPQESYVITKVLAAIYHLGAAGVVKGPNNKPFFAKPAEARNAATLLGTTTEDLSKAIFNPTFSASRGMDVTEEKMTGLEALEGFVVGLYTEVFNVVISLINRSLASTARTKNSILLMDTPGFQDPTSTGRSTGATFEDLCYNYVQERVHMLFHDKSFTEKQERYMQENIEVDLEEVRSSPQDMINLLDKCTSQQLLQSTGNSRGDLNSLGDEDKGILWLLDDQAITPGSNELEFVEKIMECHSQAMQHSERMLSVDSERQECFTLRHFQGTAPVTYNVTGWLKACRENPASKQAINVLVKSESASVSEIFSSIRVPTSSSFGASPAKDTTLRRANSLRRLLANQAGLKKRSVPIIYKYQMDSLIETLSKTRVHFVCNMLPHAYAGLSDLDTGTSVDDMILSVPEARQQIRGVQLLLAIRHHRQGFPEHMTFGEFVSSYEILAPADKRPKVPIMDQKTAVLQIIECIELDESKFRIGLSQIFFKAGALAQLNDEREEKRSEYAIKLQKHFRRFLAQKLIAKLKVKHAAVACIQKNSRIYFRLRDWQWWKLYTKIKPLLNVQRTEEELRDKESELVELRSRVEKIDKERIAYKSECVQLEEKLGMVQSDYSQERSTSSQATEILEQETGKRMMLERELRDLQNKYNISKQERLALEKELEQCNLWSQSLQNEPDDDLDGNLVPRTTYDHMVKDQEFKRRKIQQELDTDIEKLEEAKHKVDRQLHESELLNEEQGQQIHMLKKKLQKMNEEQQDMKRHLEESASRNSDLEKRHRRFDNELALAVGDMREETAHKERLQRERDQLLKQKYTLSQQLEDVTATKDILQHRVNRLEVEMNEMKSSGSGGEVELHELRTAKHELERKLAEQEEEIGDMQQEAHDLEIVKLKLQMEQGQMRAKHQRELENLEKEMEDLRDSATRKFKAAENRVADLEDELHDALTAKREAERKLLEYRSIAPERDLDHERELKVTIRRLKTLLTDAQLQLSIQKESNNQRANIRALESQLEDVQSSLTAALKSKCSLELELRECQQQAKSAVKSKMEAEEKVSKFYREKANLENDKEDLEEEMSELVKRYQAIVSQSTVSTNELRDQAEQITNLTEAKARLQEEVDILSSRVLHLESSFEPKEKSQVLDMKCRELEQKLDFERTMRNRYENQTVKVKDSLEKLQEEYAKIQIRCNDEERRYKSLQSQLSRSLEEEEERSRKDVEQSQTLAILGQKLELCEAEKCQLQSDLKTANQRISHLKAGLEESVISDYEDEDYSSENSDY